MMRLRLWVILCAALPSIGFAQAQIKDVTWSCGKDGCGIAFRFSDGKALPSFLQKFDAAKGVYRIAFASTGSTLAKGSFAADSSSPWIQGVSLVSDVSSSGVPLLAFDFRVGNSFRGDKFPTELKQPTLFVVRIGKDGGGKQWRLSALKSVKKTTNPVAAIPVAATPVVASKAKLPPSAPAVVPAIAQPQVPDAVAPVTSKPMAESSQPLLLPPLVDMGWYRGFGQEQVVLRLREGKQPTNTVFKGDTLLIQTAMPGSGSHASMQVPGSLLAKSIIASPVSGNWEIRVVLQPAMSAKVILRKDRVLIQSMVSDAQSVESWNARVGSRRFALDSDQDAGLDTFADNLRASAKPVSTSQIFTLQKGDRELIVVVDAAILRVSPKDGAATIDTLGFGDRVQVLGLDGIWYQIQTSASKGWISKRQVSYRDELTKAQQERLQVMATSAPPIQTDSTVDSLAVKFDQVEEEKVAYSSFGRRDPFIDLDGPTEDGINIDGVELVGIIWESETPMALLSDLRNAGVSYTLKEGDKITNGKVLKITPEEIVFLIHEFGISRRYSMSLPDRNGGK